MQTQSQHSCQFWPALWREFTCPTALQLARKSHAACEHTYAHGHTHGEYPRKLHSAICLQIGVHDIFSNLFQFFRLYSSVWAICTTDVSEKLPTLHGERNTWGSRKHNPQTAQSNQDESPSTDSYNPICIWTNKMHKFLGIILYFLLDALHVSD